MSSQGKNICICSHVIYVENKQIELVITSLSFAMEVHCIIIRQILSWRSSTNPLNFVEEIHVKLIWFLFLLLFSAALQKMHPV